MADALGWRAKIGVLVPSTNTIVQPDFEAMRPEGVTNHVSRIMIPNVAMASDEDFLALMAAVGGELTSAAERVMTAAPDILVIGISSTIFWDGYGASEARRAALEAHVGVPVTGGSFAIEAALRALGARRVAALSPYQPIVDAQVTRFLGDRGFEVARRLVAHVSQCALGDEHSQRTQKVGQWYRRPVALIRVEQVWDLRVFVRDRDHV